MQIYFTVIFSFATLSPHFAVIIVEPFFLAVTFPELVIEATVFFDEVQVVFSFPPVSIAESWSVSPFFIVKPR